MAYVLREDRCVVVDVLDDDDERGVDALVGDSRLVDHQNTSDLLRLTERLVVDATRHRHQAYSWTRYER